MPSADDRQMLSSFALLERTLDRAIASLTAGAQTRETRTLLIEARRLRSVIANWRSIPPSPTVRDEMMDRVLQLAASVGAAPASDGGGEREARAAANRKAPERADTVKVPMLPRPVDDEMDATIDEGRQDAYDTYDTEETEAYSIDFEPRLYSFEGGAAAPPPPAEPAPRPAARQAFHKPSIFTGSATVTLQADLQPLARASAARRSDPPPRAESRPPTGVHAPERAPSVPPPSIAIPHGGGRPPAFSLSEERLSPPPRPSPVPERAPSVPPPSVAIVLYDHDRGRDVLAGSQTRIVTSPVKMADPPDPLLAQLVDPLSPRTDAYRAIRRRLAAGYGHDASDPDGARVLGVTSAGRGEGKTVFSLNLALTLRDGARGAVLVVDANPLAPGVAKLLGVTPPDCFLAQLARHAENPGAPWVVAEPLPRLHVLAIDPRVKHPPLLDPVAFSQGITRLKQAGYEHIVVDAPHVLGSGNGNVIADAVDALILTALPMKSVRRQMRKAVEQLEPAPILGVVVLEG